MYCTLTTSLSFGLAPLPSVMTWYCRPEAVVFTPGFFAFSARNFVPASAFLRPLAIISAICLARIFSPKAISTWLACSSVISSFSPASEDLIARAMVSTLTSSLSGSSCLAIRMPIM